MCKWVEVPRLLATVPRRWPLDLQLCSVGAGGTLLVSTFQAQEYLHDLIKRILCVYLPSTGRETKFEC